MSDGSDRTEDLEQRVSELEATVRGLTEELVDATERIRQLERETGAGEGPEEKRASRDRKRVTPSVDETEESDDGDTTKAEDPEGSEETEESESDDIIVA